MKYIPFAFLFLFIACRQKENTAAPAIVQSEQAYADSVMKVDEVYFEGQACMYQKSDKQISTTYPFDKSDKIELVSYEDRKDNHSNDDLIKDGKFVVPNILERKTLGRIQKDSLFAIFFNHKKMIKNSDEVRADCYDPHHSILFYEKGQLIAFYQICFMCGGTKQTKGIDFGEFCNEKLCMLQKFFKWNEVNEKIIDEMCDWQKASK